MSQRQQRKITNSTVTFIILRNGRFTHRRRINGESGTLYEFPNLFLDVMADCTRIDKDDYFMTSLLHELLNLVKNKVFFSHVCHLSDGPERGFQPAAGDFVVHSIGREFKVHRPSLI